MLDQQNRIHYHHVHHHVRHHDRHQHNHHRQPVKYIRSIQTKIVLGFSFNCSIWELMVCANWLSWIDFLNRIVGEAFVSFILCLECSFIFSLLKFNIFINTNLNHFYWNGWIATTAAAMISARTFNMYHFDNLWWSTATTTTTTRSPTTRRMTTSKRSSVNINDLRGSKKKKQD